MQLNQENYKQLNDFIKTKQPGQTNQDHSYPDWYTFTYDIFLDSPINTIQDFWRVVAYTYSWMPTIPTIKRQLIKDEAQLIKDLQALKQGNHENLEQLFRTLIPVINNSLVGVSKALHFIAPDTVPIIDSNVARGWNEFFSAHQINNDIKFPTYSNALSIKQLPNYLKYRETLLSWVANSTETISLRELELAFFELGIALNRKYDLVP